MDLTIFIITGILSKEKMLTTQARYYAERTTKSILCDMSKATWTNMDSAHALRAMSKARPHARARKGCKTAVVVKGDHDFGITQMFASSASAIEYGPEIMVFKNISAASEWLEIPKI